MTLIKAQDVKVGDQMHFSAVDQRLVTVGSIRTNPFYGWIGFSFEELQGDFNFRGWFNPQDYVEVEMVTQSLSSVG